MGGKGRAEIGDLVEERIVARMIEREGADDAGGCDEETRTQFADGVACLGNRGIDVAHRQGRGVPQPVRIGRAEFRDIAVDAAAHRGGGARIGNVGDGQAERGKNHRRVDAMLVHHLEARLRVEAERIEIGPFAHAPVVAPETIGTIGVGPTKSRRLRQILAADQEQFGRALRDELRRVRAIALIRQLPDPPPILEEMGIGIDDQTVLAHAGPPGRIIARAR